MVIYPLLKGQKEIISEWKSRKDKPLLINGESGMGKSSLAKELLKEYHIIEITTEHIKYSGDIIDYIKSSLFKKDILMMCSHNHYKGLLIDDFHYFIKQDKTNAIKLITFIKTISINHPVIIICNNITHKLYNQLKDISYIIICKLSNRLCKKIFNKTYDKKKHIDCDNLHDFKTTLNGFNIHIDKVYSINSLLEKLLYDRGTVNSRYLVCSSDYNILSLNILENSDKILRNFNTLYDIYKSICIYDMLQTKYIDKYVPYDIYILYSCIIPSYYVRKNRVYKKISFTYNKYISRSLIQIHNQSLLSSFNYLELLNLLYIHKLKDKKKQILSIINKNEYNKNTLFKQVKVYNYFFNKNITKKYITQTFKNISS